MAATGLLLLSSAGAIAAPKRLDCNLTDLETKVGPNFNVEAENRAITVVFDAATKALTVYQDGSASVLKGVTMTQISMNGSTEDMSVGIDPSSLSIVFQTYKPGSMHAEFGVCKLSEKPPP